MNHSTSNNGIGATAAPTITAWAIKAPDDSIDPDTVMSFITMTEFDLRYNMKRGFRCVRVQIQEVQE